MIINVFEIICITITTILVFLSTKFIIGGYYKYKNREISKKQLVKRYIAAFMLIIIYILSIYIILELEKEYDIEIIKTLEKVKLFEKED